MDKTAPANTPAPAAPIRSLAALMLDLKAGIAGDTISLGDLAEALHERGIAMLLLLLAMPMALPLPVPPGINVMLASPLVLLTAQQAMGAHRIWLPETVRARTMPAEKLRGVIDMCVPWLRRLELLVRPRLGFLTQDGASRLFGFAGLVMALTVLIPVPLTNTVPSLGIALMAAGFMMRDGLAVLAGAVIGICWVTLLAVCVTLFGAEAFTIIKEAIRSVLV